jgi:biotin transport system substrate-specific component
MMNMIMQEHMQSRIVATASACHAHVSTGRGVISVVGFAVLVALGAQIRIPLPGSDVPMTLQVLAVLLAGYLLPPRRAVGAIALYLACGIAGLPVFAPDSGGLLGSTGGYLAGFAVCAWIVGTIAGDRGAGVARLVLAGILGFASVFLLGIGWRVVLVLAFGAFDGRLSWVIVSGTAPFLVKAAIEILLAVALVVRIRAIGKPGRSDQIDDGKSFEGQTA